MVEELVPEITNLSSFPRGIKVSNNDNDTTTLIIKKRLCNKTKKKETNLEIYNAKILPKLYI